MAAAILFPLIASLAPPIVGLITSLVHRSAQSAEQQLGSGTGPVKFARVFSDVMTALQQAAAVGAIDKTLPSDGDVKLIIQSVVTSMQGFGLLNSAAASSLAASLPSSSASSQVITLKSGDKLGINVQ